MTDDYSLHGLWASDVTFSTPVRTFGVWRSKFGVERSADLDFELQTTNAKPQTPNLTRSQNALRFKGCGGILSWAMVFAALLLPWPTPAQSPSPAIPDPAKAGQEIASRLRKAGPEKSATFDGWMTIVRRGQTNTLPIRSRIEVTPTNWLIRYIAGTNLAADTLTIVHTPGRPNLYYSTTGTNAQFRDTPLTAGELFQPFGGSDFWRIDLGLDFLGWPVQRQIDHQMRRGRACRVLESRPAAPIPGGYLRVKSWVDVENDGILKAEAYDSRDQRIKEFKVGPFRKVDGVYQLEEMSMGNPDTSEETRIRFNLDG